MLYCPKREAWISLGECDLNDECWSLGNIGECARLTRLLQRGLARISSRGETLYIREAAAIHYPGGVEEVLLQKVRPARGFGRWIYCKYCGKNVRPMLSGVNQIVCGECGAGLTPDFFKLENLKRWMDGDESALDEDVDSPEAREYLARLMAGLEDGKTWRIIRRRRDPRNT